MEEQDKIKNKIEEQKMTEEQNKMKSETKKQNKIRDKKEIADIKIKKESAVVNGRNIGISTKYSIKICDMIRGKTIEMALKMLEEVTKMKRVVKMNNMEIPHKKGKGVMAGRYPIEACKEFIRLIKQLNANAIANELETEGMVIFCKANRASRPYKSGGRRAKRTHITLILEKEKIGRKNRKKK